MKFVGKKSGISGLNMSIDETDCFSEVGSVILIVVSFCHLCFRRRRRRPPPPHYHHHNHHHDCLFAIKTVITTTYLTGGWRGGTSRKTTG